MRPGARTTTMTPRRIRTATFAPRHARRDRERRLRSRTDDESSRTHGEPPRRCAATTRTANDPRAPAQIEREAGASDLDLDATAPGVRDGNRRPPRAGERDARRRG